MVPACHQRQPRIAGKIQSVATNVVQQQEEDRDGNQRAGQAKDAESAAQGLGDGADHVNRVGGNKSENRAGPENVQEGDKRGREEDGLGEIASRVARLSSEDGDNFESGQGPEGHLAEDAEAEKRERRENQRERVVVGQGPVAQVQKRQRNQDSQDEDSEDASRVAYPLAHAEAESRDHHHTGDQGDGTANQQEWARRNPFSTGPGSVRDVGGGDERDL